MIVSSTLEILSAKIPHFGNNVLPIFGIPDKMLAKNCLEYSLTNRYRKAKKKTKKLNNHDKGKIQQQSFRKFIEQFR